MHGRYFINPPLGFSMNYMGGVGGQKSQVQTTVIADILDWDHAAAFPTGYFDVGFACPPCERFSRVRTTKPRDLASV